MKRVMDVIFGREQQQQEAERLSRGERRKIQMQTAEIQESVELLRAKVAGLKASVDRPDA